MTPNPRKRANAFEDFTPAETQANGKVKPVSVTAVTDEQPKVERIERLNPSQMMPDRFQPRRLLPTAIRTPFFGGEIDCYQAAAQWLEFAHSDPAHHQQVEQLLAMGTSFEKHGQIKPITGSWITLPDGRFIFQIETGERRFWAACLRFVKEKQLEEPLLRVEVVAAPTRQRQVLENRHSEPPSAVGQACEVAALILAELGIAPEPTQTDEYDYFRQARSQRMPAGLWDRVMPVMQLTRPRMVQLLNILQLPTPLLEATDRYRLPERVLREILALPQQQWDQVIKLSIQNSLTSDDVAALVRPPRAEPSQTRQPSTFIPPDRIALSGLRRFANALNDLDEFSQAGALDEVANTLLVTGEADGMMLFLGDLASRIDARRMRRNP